MKSLNEYIQESLDVKSIFDKPIRFGKDAISYLKSVGVDSRHEDDEFKLKADGSLVYTNPYLFTGYLTAKIAKSKLGKALSDTDRLKFDDHISGSASSFDMSREPAHWMKAIYNAIASQSYQEKTGMISLDNIAYTDEDYKEDCK